MGRSPVWLCGEDLEDGGVLVHAAVSERCTAGCLVFVSQVIEVMVNQLMRKVWAAGSGTVAIQPVLKHAQGPPGTYGSSGANGCCFGGRPGRRLSPSSRTVLTVWAAGARPQRRCHLPPRGNRYLTPRGREQAWPPCALRPLEHLFPFWWGKRHGALLGAITAHSTTLPARVNQHLTVLLPPAYRRLVCGR